MAWTTWALAATALIAVSGSKIEPPPVILDLGRIEPTPEPTAQSSHKKRLISVITVRNNVDGESRVTFEATDVATEGKKKSVIIGAKSYSPASDDEKPEVRALGERILLQIRELERDMLEYAEKAGPPKSRAPLGARSRDASDTPPE